VQRWTRNLVVVFLSLLGVFLLEQSTPVVATNSAPKRVLILNFFGRAVAPFFNEEGGGDG
jgi:hypothetical protein